MQITTFTKDQYIATDCKLVRKYGWVYKESWSSNLNQEGTAKRRGNTICPQTSAAEGAKAGQQFSLAQEGWPVLAKWKPHLLKGLFGSADTFCSLYKRRAALQVATHNKRISSLHFSYSLTTCTVRLWSAALNATPGWAEQWPCRAHRHHHHHKNKPSTL